MPCRAPIIPPSTSIRDGAAKRRFAPCVERARLITEAERFAFCTNRRFASSRTRRRFPCPRKGRPPTSTAAVTAPQQTKGAYQAVRVRSANLELPSSGASKVRSSIPGGKHSPRREESQRRGEAHAQGTHGYARARSSVEQTAHLSGGITGAFPTERAGRAATTRLPMHLPRNRRAVPAQQACPLGKRRSSILRSMVASSPILDEARADASEPSHIHPHQNLKLSFRAYTAVALLPRAIKTLATQTAEGAAVAAP